MAQPSDIVVSLPQRPKRNKKNRSKNIVVQTVSKQNGDGKMSKSQKRKLRRNRVTIDQTLSKMAQQGTLGQSRAIADLPMTLVERIAMSIAAPMNQPIYRFSDQYTDSETAVANPFEKVKANWKTTDGVQLGVDNQNLPCFVFRNAERAAVLFDANPSGLQWQYNFSGTDSVTLKPQPTFTQELLSAIESEALHMPYALPSTDYQPHGALLLAGKVLENPDDRFTWYNDKDTIELSFTLPPNGGGTYLYSVYLDYWDSTTGFLASQVVLALAGAPVPAGTYTVSALAETLAAWKGSGYYAPKMQIFSYDNVGALSYGLRVPVLFNYYRIKSVGACFGHRTIKDYVVNSPSVNGIRVQAAAVRYCNVASLLNLQGQVTVLQLSEQRHWKEYIDYTKLSSVKTTQENTFDVRDGAYVYLKSTDAEDMKVQAYTLTDNGIIRDSFYPIKEQSAFIVCFPSITNGDGRSGFFEIVHGVEYGTVDVWRNVQKSNITEETFKKAAIVLRNLPQYHKNNKHIDALLKGIKQLGQIALRGALKAGIEALPGLLL